MDELNWREAVIVEDRRHDWGELRLMVIALLDGEVHVAIITPQGDDPRVISFRRARKKAGKLYEQYQTA